MRNIKIISAVSALAIAGMMTIYSAVFAQDNITGNSQINIENNTIPLTKSIVMLNENSSEVYEPNITYSYTVTPVNPGSAVVNDKTNSAVVNAGINQGVQGTSIVFSSQHTAETSPTGKELEKSASLTVNPDVFPHAGIYRYCVTESTSVDVTVVGMETRGADYDSSRYLDVYIANGENGLELSNAVLFKTVSSVPGTDTITTNTDKTTGFEPGTENYADDSTVDRYKTYDMTVKKTVQGNLADKTHSFPFAVTFENAVPGAKYICQYNDTEETGSVSDTGRIEKGSAVKESILKLKHDQTVKFIGIPSNTAKHLSAEITELNDTSDKYTTSVKAGNQILLNDTQLSAEETAGVHAYDVKANDTSGHTVIFTNQLAEISPTGLLFRVFPYAVLLGGATVLMSVYVVRRTGKI